MTFFLSAPNEIIIEKKELFYSYTYIIKCEIPIKMCTCTLHDPARKEKLFNLEIEPNWTGPRSGLNGIFVLKFITVRFNKIH